VSEEVVLVPGLWMPAVIMAPLAARLARAGFRPRRMAYSGRRSLEAALERLARERAVPHFVGHSLGGVLVLEMLNRSPEVPVASAVLLGAPVRGCFAGRRLGQASLGRWMMGACGPLWEPRSATWKRAAPLGVVAGTVPLGLGRTFGRLPGDNDGVVCVEETAVDGMTARALVAQGHSMLPVSASVGKLVERFLGTGRFE